MQAQVESQATDAELLAMAREGDSSAFSRLYSSCAPGLHLYAQSLTRDAHLADDIVQEAYLRLFQRAGLNGSIASYLYTVARHLAIDEFRLRASRKEPPRLVPRNAADAADADVIARALDSLAPEQREVVVLKHYGGLTFPQIAHVTSVPVGTAASRYRYALDKLARLLTRRDVP